MALKATRVRRFGGLDLTADPADVGLGRATSGRNFDLAPDLSYVRCRPGFTRLTTIEALSGVLTSLLHPQGVASAGGRLLAVGIDAGTTTAYVDAVSAVGGVTAVGNWAVAGNPSWRFRVVTHGTPTTTIAFIATDDGAGVTLRKVTGTTLAASVGEPLHLGVTPLSNRLIQAGFYAAADSPTGANGSLSTVFFSDEGAPETYAANNYIHLRPGDGERITAVVSWQGSTFVFKQTACFIFAGETLDSAANPIFDYRVLELPARVTGITPACAGRRGVYYTTPEGVWRTTGGTPQLMSAPLTARFRDAAFAAAASSTILSAAGGRVILGSPTVTDDAYVMDEASGEWMAWGTVNRDDAWSNVVEFAGTRAFTFSDQNTIYYADEAATSDDGDAIASSYISGLDELGTPTPKNIRRAEVTGTGTVTFALAADYVAAPTGSSLTLGTAPTADNAFHSTASRGARHGYKLSAASGAWRVNEIALMHSPPSPPATAR